MKQAEFSVAQENKIRSIVGEELVPIKEHLARHDAKFDQIDEKLDRHEQNLHNLNVAVINLDTRLTRVEEKIDALPTMAFISELMDAQTTQWQLMYTELKSLQSTSIRHDQDIYTIKTHLQLQ